jgi:hypothetical protein
MVLASLWSEAVGPALVTSPPGRLHGLGGERAVCEGQASPHRSGVLPVADPSTLPKVSRAVGTLEVWPRHSWLCNGQQESVAEHCWQMALMALVVHRELREPVDIEKTLKMILTRDLVEAETGRHPARPAARLSSTT